MHARLRASGGTRERSSFGMRVEAHQHGPLYAAVVQSWQSFALPQSGQRLASPSFISAAEGLDSITRGIAFGMKARGQFSWPPARRWIYLLSPGGTKTDAKPSTSDLPLNTSTRMN